MSQLCILGAWNLQQKFLLTLLCWSWYHSMKPVDAAQVASSALLCFLPANAWEDLGNILTINPANQQIIHNPTALKYFSFLTFLYWAWCNPHSLLEHVSTFFEDALLSPLLFSAAPVSSPPLSSHLSLPFLSLIFNSFLFMLPPLITSPSHSAWLAS